MDRITNTLADKTTLICISSVFSALKISLKDHLCVPLVDRAEMSRYDVESCRFHPEVLRCRGGQLMELGIPVMMVKITF